MQIHRAVLGVVQGPIGTMSFDGHNQRLSCDLIARDIRDGQVVGIGGRRFYPEHRGDGAQVLVSRQIVRRQSEIPQTVQGDPGGQQPAIEWCIGRHLS